MHATARSLPPIPEGDRELLAGELLDVLRRFRRRFERLVPADAAADLSACTPTQMEALGWLVRTGGAAMHELAEAQCVGVSSATALADRLIRQGFAERVAEPGDRRVVRLVPTDAGRVLVERVGATKRALAVATLEDLSETEAATLIHLLRRVAGGPGTCR